MPHAVSKYLCGKRLIDGFNDQFQEELLLLRRKINRPNKSFDKVSGKFVLLVAKVFFFIFSIKRIS